MTALPLILVAFRAACAPAVIVLAWRGSSGTVIAGVVLAAFLSDVFDGVVARHIGIVTPALRRADTIVDTVFYVSATVALLIVAPGVLDAAATLISALIVVHVSRAVFELTKYGRIASYHMWSARVWGIVLFAALERAFMTGRPTILLTAALVVGILNELEGFAASIVLDGWHHDVPSLVHAVRASRPAMLTLDRRPWVSCTPWKGRRGNRRRAP